MITIIPKSIESKDAVILITELNKILTKITGDDGTAHFQTKDLEEEHAVFLIGYIDGEASGCGALRMLSEQCGEIKRVYARKNKCGLAHCIIEALEQEANKYGYQKILLETRVQNKHAIAFYESCGYEHCENYGVYVGKNNAYCMSKQVIYK